MVWRHWTEAASPASWMQDQIPAFTNLGPVSLLQPADRPNPSKLRFKVPPFVEGEPSVNRLFFTGRAIRELGIRVQTRHRRIRPGMVAMVPRGDDPAGSLLR